MDARDNEVRSERAHYMCPHMHFGILARLAAEYDGARARRSAAAVQRAHPLLQSLIAEEDGRLYYRRQEHLAVPLVEKPEAGRWPQDYEEAARRGWDVRRECLLRMTVYPQEKGFQVLFTAHHLLCDGRGLLQLAQEFARHYCLGEAPQLVEERLIRSLGDLPPHSGLPLVSRLLVDGVNKSWDDEGRRVSYEEYAAFEQAYLRCRRVQWTASVIERGEVGALQALCKEHGVSVNDYLVAKMMQDEDTDKVVVAADIRHRLGCYRQGAMGNYATAFSVTVRRRTGERMDLAKQVARRIAAIRRDPRRELLVLACYLRMRPQLIDAVAVSTLGTFASRAGAFVGERMFGYGTQDGCGLTNLGKIESRVLEDAVFIPPASPANRKTLGVLTVNGRMNLCTAALQRPAGPL